MNVPIVYLCAFSIFLAFTLLFYNKGYKGANVFLSGYLFCSSLFILTQYFFIYSKSVSITAVFVTVFPSLFYLIGPFAYLYVRSILLDNVKISKKDYFHFLPFLIIFIGVIPFLFSSWDYKCFISQKIINHTYMGSKYSVNFLVPKAINQPIRSPFALFYLILIAKTGMKNKTFFNSSSQAKIIKNWLRLFILLFSISFIFYIIAQLAFYFDLKIFFENLWFYYLIHGIAFTYLLINLLLIVFPQVLYGLPIPKLVINDKDYDLATDPFQEISESSHPIVKIKSTNSLPFYSFEYEKEMEKAINIWISEKKYLELNASLISLSDYTNIPVHHLSYNFNSLLKIKYSDWRNTLRIEYAKSQIDAGLNKSITLEALAIESGFASQATFIKSFKNVFGCTPSEYIKTKKH
jgi:AraC-like DNA-binding protein